MKMKVLAAVAVLLMSTSLSSGAAVTGQQLADAFLNDGYTRVEVKVGATQAKVEAIRGNIKVEVTYDLATGDILKRETESVRPGEDTSPGVETAMRLAKPSSAATTTAAAMTTATTTAAMTMGTIGAAMTMALSTT
jgi:hypothetical protein